MMPERPFIWTPPTGPISHGFLATDDPLWIKACSRAEVQSLIEQPYHWIRKLNDCADKFSIILPSFFAIQVSLRKRPKPAKPVGAEIADRIEAMALLSDPLKPYIVQGISGTGVIIIRPTPAAAVKNPQDDESNAKWEGYWQTWQDDDTDLNVTMARPYGQGFAHIQLSEGNVLPSLRADQITAFLMWGANSALKYTWPDHLAKGHYGKTTAHINRILLKVPANIGVLDDATGAVVRGTPTQAACMELQDFEVDNSTFSYIGRESDFHPHHSSEKTAKWLQDGTTDQPACDDMAGTTDPNDPNGQICMDDFVTKSYDPNVPSGFR